MSLPGYDPDELPDVTSTHYPRDQTPVATDGLCELCGQRLLVGVVRVCGRCLAANPTIGAALRAAVNEPAR